MNIFYFSGVEKRATAEALQKESACAMMSQLRYTENLMAACAGLTLVMDSGAYTKQLTLPDIEKYARVICKLGDRCAWYANADVIGDQAASNQNYALLLSLLPDNLHEQVLWIYQASADIRYLYEGLEKHRRLGVGGLVPYLRSKVKGIQVISQIAPVIRASSAEPHYFGVGTLEIIEFLHTCHDSFSVDNTTWLAGSRYGQLINKEGKQRPASAGGYDFNREAILTQNIRTMRKWVEIKPHKALAPAPTHQPSLFSN